MLDTFEARATDRSDLGGDGKREGKDSFEVLSLSNWEDSHHLLG
jgi:hypothetical protein